MKEPQSLVRMSSVSLKGILNKLQGKYKYDQEKEEWEILSCLKTGTRKVKGIKKARSEGRA